MAYNFSHKIGVVAEVRPITITDVYEGQAGVRSATSHSNKCRVRWDDGAEEFVTCSGDYSVGDRVAVVWEGDRRVTDLNLNTNAYEKVATPDTLLRGWLTGMALLPVFFVLGLLVRSWLVALAGFPAIFVCVFVVSRRSKQRTAALNAALAEYLKRLK